MSDYDDRDPYADDDWPRRERAAAPPGGRVLWGRVAFFGIALLLAFLIGRFTAPGDDAETVADLEDRIEELEEREEALQAEIDALEAGGVDDADDAADDEGAAESGAEVASDDSARDADDEPENADDAATAEGADADEGEGGAAADDDTTVHIVAEGEHLFGIAEQHYGDGERWRDIAEANGLTSDDVVRPGMELEIPPP